METLERKLRRQGNSKMVGLPKEVLKVLGAEESDILKFVITSRGIVKLEKVKGAE